MKTITVKNLSLQFDTYDKGADQHTVRNFIEEFNIQLQERFPDSQAQIIAEDDIDFKIK